MVSAMGSAADMTTAAAFACCRACTTWGISSALTLKNTQSSTQLTDKIVQCATNTFASYSGTDVTARCVSLRTAVTGAAPGTCPVSNTGAGVSLLPSLALIIAIVAALLSLFA
jgi:hypothetical protein